MVKQYSSRMYRAIGAVGTSRLVTRLHPHVYRATGGRWPIGRNFGVLNVIVTMTGRRTGKLRDVPLFAFEDGPRLVVIGSNAGDDREPAWVGNLRANPHASVRVGHIVRPVRARDAEGEERDRLWALAAHGYPGYELYRQMTARHIPVVVLEPVHQTGHEPAPEPGAPGEPAHEPRSEV
jgi:deazaflavin-dependent oxidoreductase (nitroreductase family)